MNEHLQIRPYLVDVRFARDFQDALQQHHRPGGYTQDIGYILPDGGLGYLFYFGLPFAHQGDFQARGTGELSPKGQVFQDHCRNIAVIGVGIAVELIDLLATTYG